VDFEAATRDPNNPKRFKPEFDPGDHLHPNDAGYKAMAEAVSRSSKQKNEVVAGAAALKSSIAAIFFSADFGPSPRRLQKLVEAYGQCAYSVRRHA